MIYNFESKLVWLSPVDEDLARSIAVHRHGRNRQAGRTNQLVDTSHNALDNELQGVRAEMAARHVLGVSAAFDDLCLVRPDTGFDIEISGITIDVKFSWKPDGNLIFNSFAKFRAKVALLVCKNDSLLRVAGVISQVKFGRKYHWWHSPYQNKLIPVVDQGELSPIEKLIEAIKLNSNRSQ